MVADIYIVCSVWVCICINLVVLKSLKAADIYSDSRFSIKATLIHARPWGRNGQIDKWIEGLMDREIDGWRDEETEKEWEIR